VSRGVSAPVRALTHVFYNHEKSPLHGKCTFICELQVIQDQSKFNVDVPHALFEVKIPNGMTVIDRARNVVYTHGSSDPDKYLAQLAVDERKRIDGLSPADRTPPDTVFIPDNDPPRWLRPFGIGMSLIAVITAIYVLRRRRSGGVTRP